LAAVGEAYARDARGGARAQQLYEPRAEAELDADVLQALAQRAHHVGQLVGADVRARVDQDLGRRPVQGEDLEHVAHRAALVRARVELAVAVCASAPFTEAVVAVRIHAATAGEALQVAPPGLHRLASIKHDRAEAGTGQLIGAEQTAG